MNIPSKMKAVVLTGPGEYEIRTVDTPAPGDGEVLCKIMAVAICGSDPAIIRGDHAGRWPPAYPFIAGHEWAGVVVAAGSNAAGFRTGDRVAGEAHCGCGTCDNCKKGRYALCLNYNLPQTGHRHYGFVSGGAYAQYQAYVPKALSGLPDGVSYAEGAMNDAAGVALHGAEFAGVTPGGTSVVIGPGPVGLLAMRIARAMGSARVIVVGRDPRLRLAAKYGADHTVDFTRQDPVEVVRALTGRLGADEVFECSGAPGTMAWAIEMARRGGSVGLLGFAADGAREPVPFRRVVNDEIRIVGVKANPNVSARVLNMISAGRLAVKDLITHRFPIEDFGAALETFTKRLDGAVKVVVLPNGEECSG